MQNGLKVQLRCLRLVSNQTPSLRFPGFSKPWEQKKLVENVDFYTGLTYSPENVTKEGTLVLRSSNVKNGEIVNADNVYVDPKYVNSKNVEIGDVIVVVRNGSRNLIGKHASVTEEMSNTVIGAFMTGIRSEAPGFINALLDTDQFAIEINKNLGATINQITTGNFKSMQFYFPHHNEQVKLGAFFKNLDDMIFLHQQELDTLKQTKQGFLQKMFPKEGESVPELRFSGFTDDWEKSKIGEITDSFSGGTPSASNKIYYGGAIPFIRSGEINSESTELFLTEEGLKNSSAKLVNKGDVLYAMYGATSGEVSISKINGAINQAILALKPKGENDANFITQWLIRQKTSIVNTFLQGGQGNLSGTIVKEIFIPIPKSKEEQIQIGNFFEQLDEVIALQQQELDALKQTKKAFLQKMFV